MSSTATTTAITNNEGRTIGWATQQADGRITGLCTDNGIDLIQHCSSLDHAQAILLEHRHQTMH